MKVLVINGSPRTESNSKIVIEEMKKIFTENNIETNVFDIGTSDIRGCIACYSCSGTGKCVFDDCVNKIAEDFEKSDALVLVSPVYWASPNGSLISLLDRLFLSTKFDKTMKVGAAIACARRGGTTATFDVLNKYFGINGMPVAPSQYWNVVHGRTPGEVLQDEEGMQIVRTLAKNMVFMMKSFALGKDAIGLPEKENKVVTNFIK